MQQLTLHEDIEVNSIPQYGHENCLRLAREIKEDSRRNAEDEVHVLDVKIAIETAESATPPMSQTSFTSNYQL